jgi:tetratricopeptide (TPR) repeat protein
VDGPEYQAEEGAMPFRSLILCLCSILIFINDADAKVERRGRPPVDAAKDETSQQTRPLSFSISDWVEGLSNTRLVHAIAKPEAMSYARAAQVWSIANDWLQHTEFNGTVRVNQPYKEIAINIYIVRREFLVRNQIRRLTALCPCEYLPGTSTIVCVDDALERAITYLDVQAERNATNEETLTPNDLDKARVFHRKFMIEWVIAHELGHLVNGHTAEQLKRSWELNGTRVGLDAEREADAFYVSRMATRPGSQNSAYLGLSQLITHLYGRELAAQYPGQDTKLSDVDKTITAKYSPSFHPPLILRSTILYDVLLNRYPNMVDATGYHKKIQDKVRLIRDDIHPSVPEFCSEAAIQIPLGRESAALGEFYYLYLFNGDESWAREIISRLLSNSRNIKAESPREFEQIDAAIKLAQLNWHFRNKKPDWKELERLVSNASDAVKPDAQIQLALARATTGAFKSTGEAEDAAEQMMQHINTLVSRGELDLENHNDAYDVLSTYLVISFSKNGDFSDRYLANREQIVSHILRLEPDGLRKAGVFAILMDQWRELRKIANGRDDSTKVAAWRAVAQVVRASHSYGWLVFEVIMRETELNFVHEQFANADSTFFNSVLADLEAALGTSLATAGNYGGAIDHLRLADEALTTLLRQGRADDAKQTATAQFAVRKELGSILIRGGRFQEAVSEFERLIALEEARRARPLTCDDDDADTNSAVGSLFQKFADALLGLGRLQEAIRLVDLAEVCRDRQGSRFFMLGLVRTRGLAMYFLGMKDEARTLLAKYSKGISELVDERQPSELLKSVVDGREVLITDLVNRKEEQDVPPQ